MKRSAAALVAALALVLSFAGCTKIAPAGGPAGGGRNPWTIPGHLRLGATDEPDALNPLFSHNAAADASIKEFLATHTR